MTYLLLLFSTFNKYSVKHNNAEYIASNHHQHGLGLPLMFEDTRDDISKALPSTVIALYIPLVALIQPPPPVAINVVTHWVLRLRRYLPLLCPTSPRAANGSTADTFQPLWHKLCSQLLGGALSIVPRIAPILANCPPVSHQCRHSGCSQSKLSRGHLINCPAHLSAACRSSCWVPTGGRSMISQTPSSSSLSAILEKILLISNPGKSRPIHPHGRV